MTTTITTIEKQETQLWMRVSRPSTPSSREWSLLDSIDFDDLFGGMHEGDLMPDLEMDPDLLVELTFSGGEEFEVNSLSIENINTNAEGEMLEMNDEVEKKHKSDEDKNGVLVNKSLREEIESDESTAVNVNGKKSTLHSKTGSNNKSGKDQHLGKRKTKVAWTPDLHRRFVQAVDQLGVDKAVPSRILEIMGIECLTRHNIASHLQKYRSHRKHLLAKEVEAACWSQKRHLFGVQMGGPKGGANNLVYWHPTMMGFPPYGPLHVWGHPTMDLQYRTHIWPKQPVPPPSRPPHVWTTPPPVDPSIWPLPHDRVSSATSLASQAPCHPQATLPTLNESIDEAIEDVLAKPWLPLPIGLKPPSVDTVMVELQRQGVPKIPPTSD